MIKAEAPGSQRMHHASSSSTLGEWWTQSPMIFLRRCVGSGPCTLPRRSTLSHASPAWMVFQHGALRFFNKLFGGENPKSNPSGDAIYGYNDLEKPQGAPQLNNHMPLHLGYCMHTKQLKHILVISDMLSSSCDTNFPRRLAHSFSLLVTVCRTRSKWMTQTRQDVKTFFGVVDAILVGPRYLGFHAHNL